LLNHLDLRAGHVFDVDRAADIEVHVNTLSPAWIKV
jgi:hypothetical protein